MGADNPNWVRGARLGLLGVFAVACGLGPTSVPETPVRPTAKPIPPSETPISSRPSLDEPILKEPSKFAWGVVNNRQIDQWRQALTARGYKEFSLTEWPKEQPGEVLTEVLFARDYPWRESRRLDAFNRGSQRKPGITGSLNASDGVKEESWAFKATHFQPYSDRLFDLFPELYPNREFSQNLPNMNDYPVQAMWSHPDYFLAMKYDGEELLRISESAQSVTWRWTGYGTFADAANGR